MPWATGEEGQTGGMNVMVMTAGDGREELAEQFMDCWLAAEIQTRLAEALIDSPANSEVVVSDEVAANLTDGADTVETLDLLPPSVIIDMREAWVEHGNTVVVG